MKRKLLQFVAFSFLFLGAASCTYTVPVEEEIPPIEDDVLFGQDIEPIFTNQGCISCHAGSGASGGLDLSTGNAYASIVANDAVIANDPEGSLIYTRPTVNHYGKQYTAQEAALVEEWINQGALDN